MKRIEAVIFDWAGTTVDHGSLAPLRAVTKLFSREGIPISDGEARRDMGLFKKDHIRQILAMPRVNHEWVRAAGKAPEEGDVERLFAEFQPLQMEILEAHAEVIAGVVEVSEKLHALGLKLGSSTGYTRPMLDLLVKLAATQGYRPDMALCPDDAGGGRPHPWMCLRMALDFRLSSTAAAVKVGDTVSDVQEGRNAGMWAVGISATGNEIGINAAELAALPDAERGHRVARACLRLKGAGAHYVVESVGQLEPVLEDIDARLAAGERP
ncbi:MAG TPA: phosphonoacetaldehyde hydrolase [Bryobacteraceae bacterium]|jgi:phosphonoacetaldehyde hydrolase|nr:phosphonoacetaldehyde hydrolase [Bryobacteraceae bacterium]